MDDTLSIYLSEIRAPASGLPAAGQVRAVTGLDDAVRDRDWRRQPQLAVRDRGSQVIPAVPVGFRHLVSVDLDLGTVASARKPSIEALRHGPRLTPEVTDRAATDRPYSLRTNRGAITTARATRKAFPARCGSGSDVPVVDAQRQHGQVD